MFIVLTSEDCAQLKPDTLHEILAVLGLGAIAPAVVTSAVPEAAQGMDFTDVVDLTVEQITAFMLGVNQKTKERLRVFAEHGPVIDAKLLGIENYSHFQTDLTKRTRTITGHKKAYLVTWDEWTYDNGKLVTGHYAVTTVTYLSLRKYFALADE
jgi:hypothetical protein